MEFEVSYALENEQQFWDELEDIVSAECGTHEELIDNALRAYLSFTANYKEEYLQSEYAIARCSYKLLDSSVFAAHKDYVRRQIIYCLLQEDKAATLHLIAAFLLFDGRQHEETFETMNEEGVFPILLELIQSKQNEDVALHRILLELLYEMSRIQRLRTQDLILIEDNFITYLLMFIEGLSDDVNDPYHYPVIRVLLVLNEQYMVSAHGPESSVTLRPLPNKVMKVLSTNGLAYKTFGENIILLLNRESETSLQLLILKLLYLLFTTPATYEYFYTNDLRVLVDVMIRNLLDLPLTSTALRHTYLRVLYPLLAHTQLKNPDCQYKREELLKLLYMMTSSNLPGMMHFGAIDETTKRLVSRCVQVPWLRETEEQQENLSKNFLGIGINSKAAESSLSVMEVAGHTEKPGIQTPSRGRDEVKVASLKKNGIAMDSSVDGGVGNGVPLGDDTSTIRLDDSKSPFEVEGEA
ncbi:hypothetical protein MMC19_006511 [Ptychographa xylographoides]|nr:hypothetical protein [Ptychographa xylographoides]